MKKGILFLLIVLIVSAVSAQQSTDTSFYGAAGISFTNSDNFKDTSFFSVEGGVMVDNIAVGVVVGRNNLTGAFASGDTVNNYWYEAKVAAYQPMGFVDGYALIGAGSYVENDNVFIEYGAGISKEFNAGIGVFIQVSNWDGQVYVTPGISF